MDTAKVPRVVIVGGGFAGLAAARALHNAPLQVVLIDKANHYLFQPLLYQVATAMLSPAEIATSIRQLVGSQPNTTVVMAEVVGVDTKNKRVLVDYLDKHRCPFDYDYLVLATAATHNYFGHEEFAEFAPGLKNLRGATSVRDRVLRAFEVAETEDDSDRTRGLAHVCVGRGRSDRLRTRRCDCGAAPLHAQEKLPPRRSRQGAHCLGSERAAHSANVP